MRKLCLSLVVFAIFAIAPAQERSEVAGRVMKRGVQCELLNQLLPLLMTKEQWRKVLPTIEAARDAVQRTERLEADEMKKMESKLEEAYKNGLEKGELPKRELIGEFQKLLRTFSTMRRIIADKNVADVMTKFKEVANAGQIKTASGSITPADFGYKPEELNDEARLRLFVNEVLLHGNAYEIMVKLSIGT